VKLRCYQIGPHRAFSLFNLKEDPDESKDLIRRRDLKPITARLKKKLFATWDPELEIRLATRRRADRVELDRAWTKDWLHAGHGFPHGYDKAVDSPRAGNLRENGAEGNGSA
jgi:hypothetical protein